MPTSELPLLRTSERSDFKRCPQKWVWAWRYGLRQKAVVADHFWFGIGMHRVMEHRYCGPGLKRGRQPLKVWRDWVNGEIAYVRTLPDPDNDPEPVWVEAGQLGEAMIGAYLDKYGKDERWHVISVEQTFQRIVRKRASRVALLRYAGTFDLVAIDLETGHIWLWDHKTAGYISTRHLPMDDQAGSYWAFAAEVMVELGLLKAGQQIAGILYNFLRKSLPDERPTNELGQALNKDGTVSKRQPTPLFLREEVWRTSKERATQIERIRGEGMVMQMMRRGEIPVWKTPTKDCSWCSFRDMCELHENGDDWEAYRDAKFVSLDPYAAHRPSTAE